MVDVVSAARFAYRNDLLSAATRMFNVLEPGRSLRLNWHHRHLTYALSEVEAGRIKRLIINVPPRSLKSFLTTVALPVWALGRAPHKRFICVSHSQPLARFFATQSLTVLQSSWFQRTFPECRLTSAQPSATDLRSTCHGGRLALGMGGAFTGRGAEIIICDDPIKAQDALSAAARRRVIEFADTSLWSRLNDPRTGAIILVMQRLHEDDLAGHLIRQGGWTVVSIPATAVEDGDFRMSRNPNDLYHRRTGDLIQPDREGPAELDEHRRALGMYNYAAQYQQQPIPAIGNVVRREWLKTYEGNIKNIDRIVVSWDTASTIGDHNDYSVGTVWARCGDNFFLLQVIRGRFETPKLQRLVIEVTEDQEPDVVLIEDDGVGRGLVQNIRQGRLARPLPILVQPRGDKRARLLRHLPLIEDGHLFLPSETDWLADYVDELLAFPAGRHDDQVDSTSQAFEYLSRDAARARGPYPRPDPIRRDPVRRDPVRRDPVRR